MKTPKLIIVIFIFFSIQMYSQIEVSIELEKEIYQQCEPIYAILNVKNISNTQYTYTASSSTWHCYLWNEEGHLRDYKAFYPNKSRVWLSNHNDHNGKTQTECIMKDGGLTVIQKQIDKLSFCDACSQKLIKINWSPLLGNPSYKNFTNGR